jgi:peptidoglycan/xylan/chitin deacetylase (PgdA/CDA1 family)
MIRRALIALVFASMPLVAQVPEPTPDLPPSADTISAAEALPATTPAIEPATTANATPSPPNASRVSVLGYHDFSPTLPETEMRISTAKFRWQMQALRDRGITVISLADFIAWKKNDGSITLPEKCALITIDDGWLSVYTDAFPILREFNYPFTMYLYKNYVDRGGKSLSIAMIREMLNAGATIGSHSVSHPYPKEVKRNQRQGPEVYRAFLQKELGASKQFLESKFSQAIATYVYPGGFFTPEMFPIAREIGYTHMFTVLPGKVNHGTPDETLPRYIILGTHDHIFEMATDFGSAPATPEAYAETAVTPTTQPVKPEPGASVTERMPVISADLSKVADLDPSTLVMHIAGFGQVPASFDASSGVFSWKVNRPLRQAVCPVTVTWKNRSGKIAEPALEWWFRIDHAASYSGAF